MSYKDALLKCTLFVVTKVKKLAPTKVGRWYLGQARIESTFPCLRTQLLAMHFEVLCSSQCYPDLLELVLQGSSRRPTTFAAMVPDVQRQQIILPEPMVVNANNRVKPIYNTKRHTMESVQCGRGAAVQPS